MQTHMHHLCQDALAPAHFCRKLCTLRPTVDRVSAARLSRNCNDADADPKLLMKPKQRREISSKDRARAAHWTTKETFKKYVHMFLMFPHHDQHCLKRQQHVSGVVFLLQIKNLQTCWTVRICILNIFIV